MLWLTFTYGTIDPSLCYLGFLTAVLQNHARKESVSVDSLQFDFKVTPGPEDSEESLSDVKGRVNVKEVAFKVCCICGTFKCCKIILLFASIKTCCEESGRGTRNCLYLIYPLPLL